MRKQLLKVVLVSFVVSYTAPTLFAVDRENSKIAIKSSSAQVDTILAEKDLLTAKAEQTANRRWDARSHKDIASARSAKEVATYLNFTRRESAEWNFGIETWDRWSHDEIERAGTIDETVQAWNDSRPQSKSWEEGAAKIDALCLDAAYKITKFNDLFKAVARPGSPAEKVLNEKLVALAPQAIRGAKSIPELWAITKKCPQNDELGKLVTSCWDRLALKIVRDARTLEDLRTAFYEARDGSEAQKIAVRRAAEFLPD